MITFVPCNIFERIWYSEFILENKSWNSINVLGKARQQELSLLSFEEE